MIRFISSHSYWITLSSTINQSKYCILGSSSIVNVTFPVSTILLVSGSYLCNDLVNFIGCPPDFDFYVKLIALDIIPSS